jgi:hypothetical protein
MTDILACYHGCALSGGFQSYYVLKYPVQKDMVVVVKDFNIFLFKNQVLSKAFEINVI